MKNIFLSVRRHYRDFIDHRIHLLIGIAIIDLLVIGLAILLVYGLVEFLTSPNETVQEQSETAVPTTIQGDKNHEAE